MSLNPTRSKQTLKLLSASLADRSFSEVRTDFALPMKEGGKRRRVVDDYVSPLYAFLLYRSLINLLLSSELINVHIHDRTFSWL